MRDGLAVHLYRVEPVLGLSRLKTPESLGVSDLMIGRTYLDSLVSDGCLQRDFAYATCKTVRRNMARGSKAESQFQIYKESLTGI